MIVIYDNNGKIWYNGNGMGEPDGLPFLNVEIPEGQFIESVDVSSEPHKPVFKSYPKSDMEILKEKVAELEAQNAALIEGTQSVVK